MTINLQILISASLYLIPSMVLWLLLKELSGRTTIYATLSLPGTILHEFLHFLIGLLTNAKPISFSLIPKRQGRGSLVMGSVSFANLRWYNAMPTSLAPLLGLFIILLVAIYRVNNGYVFQPMDVAIWCLLAPQFSSMWPSGNDWKASFISWPVYLVGIVALVYSLSRFVK